jgi:phage-related tail protein
MAEPRRSHHALTDERVRLSEAARLLADLVPDDGETAGRDEIARALKDATDHCDEMIRLLVIEERLGLTAVRGNAQLALRRLEMGGGLADPVALRTALRAILAAADRLMRQVEALEASAADNRGSPSAS